MKQQRIRALQPGKHWNLQHVMRVLHRTLRSRAERDRELRIRLREAASAAAATRNTQTAMAERQPISAVTRIARRVSLQQLNASDPTVICES